LSGCHHDDPYCRRIGPEAGTAYFNRGYVRCESQLPPPAEQPLGGFVLLLKETATVSGHVASAAGKPNHSPCAEATQGPSTWSRIPLQRDRVNADNGRKQSARAMVWDERFPNDASVAARQQRLTTRLRAIAADGGRFQPVTHPALR
jgi:hypothetical protein